MSCNTNCYKQDTCNTKWHRVANFGASAKIMTKMKVANIFSKHERLAAVRMAKLFGSAAYAISNELTYYHHHNLRN
eukprot:4223466-Pleurochrysis_carterae.AAC.1